MSNTLPVTLLPDYTQNKKLTVIQFFGGPCTGKSTTAAELFVAMKKQGHKVELVHEIAKDITWDENFTLLSEQDLILTMQNHLQRRLVGKVDYVISDTSLLLGLFYAPHNFLKTYEQFLMEIWSSYTNINVLLDRNPDFGYQQEGRNQSEEQANLLDQKIRQFFKDKSIPHYRWAAGDNVVQHILNTCITNKEV